MWDFLVTWDISRNLPWLKIAGQPLVPRIASRGAELNSATAR